MRNPVARLLATTALSAPLALATVAAQGAEIGTVAAVNPSMAGTPPTSQRRVLTLGQKIIQNEKVETSGDGSGQLLFLDQTTLTVAPESEIVLDKYVYDPDQQAGEIALTMTKGVLRFIGGRITKNREAIVRTPTATVGIRGGLALVIVEANGQTRVCHLAGEYSNVKSSGSGQVTLSRPNACAVVDGVQASFTGLIDDQELQEFYEQLEGTGTGGKSKAESVQEVRQVAAVNSGIRGAQTNKPVSTSGESAPDDESATDENQPDQDDTDRGNTNIVTVAAGDKPPPPPPPPQEVETPEGTPQVVNALGGAAFQGANGQNTTFQQVEFGSLIGFGGSEIVEIPVPGTGGQPLTFDSANILAGLEKEDSEGPITFSALDLHPGSGLFSFDPGTGSTTTTGPIGGVGFLDPLNSFAYIEFEGDGGESQGFAIFGTPAEFQGQFFSDDGVFTVDQEGAFDDSQLVFVEDADGNVVDVLDPDVVDITGKAIFPEFLPGTTFLAASNPDLDPVDVRLGTVNTAEVFEFQPNLLFGLDTEEGQTLTLIGNEGMARFGRDSVTLEPGTLSNGGKWLGGNLTIRTDPDGNQSSTFLVFADDVKSFGDSGPIVAGTAVSTEYFNDGNGQSVSSKTTGVGTYEDDQGNTLFGRNEETGEEGQYLVLSSLSRDGLQAGDSVAPPLALTPGEETELVQSNDGGTVTGNVSFDRFDNTPDEFVNMLALNDDLAERVTNPLPLAGSRTVSGYDLALNRFDQGFATGVARCEGGSCGGRNDSHFTVASSDENQFRITFDQEFENFGPDGSFTDAETDNQFDFSFDVESGNAGPIAGTNTGEGRIAVFQFSGGDDNSAYLDDNRFGATVSGGTGNADIAIASAGLAGTGIEFPASVETEPEFVRWGWWSASFDSTLEEGVVRRDIVHLGNFVTGVRPDDDVDNIPVGFTASYDGLAVGTHVNTFTGESRVVGGSFDMVYDFGANRGSVGLEIPDAQLFATVAVTGSGNGLTFSGFDRNDSTVTDTSVQGAFFAGGDASTLGSAAAGVGGTFQADSLEFGTETIGVFGGDRSSLVPTFTDVIDVTGPGGIDTGSQTGTDQVPIPQP